MGSQHPHPGFLGTTHVLATKVLRPGKPLGPKQTQMGSPSRTVDVASLEAECAVRVGVTPGGHGEELHVREDMVQGETPVWMRGPSSSQARSSVPAGPGCSPGGVFPALPCPALHGPCDGNRPLPRRCPRCG